MNTACNRLNRHASCGRAMQATLPRPVARSCNACRAFMPKPAASTAFFSTFRAAAAGGIRVGGRTSTALRCSYAEAYKNIKANRIARKLAKDQAAAGLEDGEEVDQDFTAKDGDTVTLQWVARLQATGELVNRSAPIFGATNKPGGIEIPVEVQVGTDVGFAPKQGLKLAFACVSYGLRAGDATTVLCKPRGGGWLRSYDILAEDGRTLCQLTNEERACPWANEPTTIELQVVKVTPAKGRESKRRLAGRG